MLFPAIHRGWQEPYAGQRRKHVGSGREDCCVEGGPLPVTAAGAGAGSGYLLSPAQAIQDDMPLANCLALIDEAQALYAG